jgi:hypothetical protein
MSRKKYGLGSRTESHSCPYCGKEIRVRLNALFSYVTVELFRSDASVDNQLAERLLRKKHYDEAVRKAEKRRKP